MIDVGMCPVVGEAVVAYVEAVIESLEDEYTRGI